MRDKFDRRFGLDCTPCNFRGLGLPMVTIPVQPGRNLAVMGEGAAMNNRHKKYGFNSAQQMADRLAKLGAGE